MDKLDIEFYSLPKNTEKIPRIPTENTGINPQLMKEPNAKSLSIVSTNIQKLSGDIEGSMRKDDISKFQNILKESLPSEIYEYFKNLTPQEIATIMAVTLGTIALCGTGFGLIPTVTALTARFGITNLFTRALIAGLSRPNGVSAIMGLIPGMKMLAPNTNISLGVNAIKDIGMAIGPTIIPAINSLKKSKSQ